MGEDKTMAGEGSTTCSAMCRHSHCKVDPFLGIAFQLSVCVVKRAHFYNVFIKAKENKVCVYGHSLFMITGQELHAHDRTAQGFVPHTETKRKIDMHE